MSPVCAYCLVDPKNCHYRLEKGCFYSATPDLAMVKQYHQGSVIDNEMMAQALLYCKIVSRLFYVANDKSEIMYPVLHRVTPASEGSNVPQSRPPAPQIVSTLVSSGVTLPLTNIASSVTSLVPTASTIVSQVSSLPPLTTLVAQGKTLVPTVLALSEPTMAQLAKRILSKPPKPVVTIMPARAIATSPSTAVPAIISSRTTVTSSASSLHTAQAVFPVTTSAAPGSPVTPSTSAQGQTADRTVITVVPTSDKVIQVATKENKTVGNTA